MFGSIKLVSGLVLSLTLLSPIIASPQPIITLSPAIPKTCPRSTITTTTTNTTKNRSITKTIVEPACPTVTVDLFHVPIPCPSPTTTTLFCNCLRLPPTSTITYGCAGKCCPTVTPTVTKAPKLGCPTGCAAVCTPGATTTVTKGC